MKMSMNLTAKEVAELEEVIKDQDISFFNELDFPVDLMDHKIHCKNKSVVMDYYDGTYDVEINEKFMIFIIRKSISIYKICKNFVSIVKDFFKGFNSECDEFIGDEDAEIKIDDMDAEEFDRKRKRIHDSLDHGYRVKLHDDLVKLLKLSDSNLNLTTYSDKRIMLIKFEETDTLNATEIHFDENGISIFGRGVVVGVKYTDDVIDIYKRIIDIATKDN